MKTPEENRVEVDMVPLIDIISLLLMFLVMVGDMEKNTSSVKMRLPRADQAWPDSIDTHNRIVVQLKFDKDENKYWAVIDNCKYELAPGGVQKTLVSYLSEQIVKRTGEGMTLGKNGEVPIPVKLRIPADAPMREAERLVTTMAQAKLVNIHYACEPIQGAAK